MQYAATSSSSPLSYTINKSMVVMAKATRKSSQESESNPRRITSNVKQNLNALKQWKECLERRSGTPKPATSYRRKKLPKKVLPGDTIEDEDEDIEDPTTTLYYTNHGIETGVPVLLVDGYNVCGYWPKLKKHFLGGKLEVARQKLIDELIAFCTQREVKVVVVFDAMMSGLPTHKSYYAGIDIVFSSHVSADTWIEKEVVALREDGCPKVWVVTSDRLQQDAANGAGAFVWSCRALISEIKDSEKEAKIMRKEQRCTQTNIALPDILYYAHYEYYKDRKYAIFVFVCTGNNRTLIISRNQLKRVTSNLLIGNEENMRDYLYHVS